MWNCRSSSPRGRRAWTRNELDRMMLMIERNDLLQKAAIAEPNALTMAETIRLNLLLFRSAYRDLVAARPRIA